MRQFEYRTKSTTDAGEGQALFRTALRFMETHEEWVYQMKVDLLRRHLADAEKEIESGRGRRLEGPDQIHGFFEGLKKRSQKKRTG